jgi:CheY-like chemotaxis protein
MATILVVDDEFAIVDLLEMVLVDEGHQVLTAANGRQGVEQLLKHPPPDLILSDYMMPILDGAGMLSEIRKTETQRNIPCIIMSSMPERNVRQRVEDIAAFIRKPFDLAKLLMVVASVLSASQSQP